MKRKAVMALFVGVLLAASKAGAVSLVTFKGQVVSVATDVNSVQVLRDDGKVTMYFTLDWRTQIRKNDKTIHIDDLQVGDSIRVRYYSNSDVPRVEVVVPHPSKAAKS